ncbi:MAG: 3-phosphoshikimate 1-carboxyvinyltransferase, partial [Thermodesulfovibrionales bacterium]
MTITRASSFRGEFSPPPDKSISHRALMFCSIARGQSSLRNVLRAADPLSTMHAMRMLGVEILEQRPGPPNGAAMDLIIKSTGLGSLSEPDNVIDCGNSGTTVRLLTGLLSGFPFLSILTGDESIRRRPMARVILPCRQMGAVIRARQGDNYPPIVVSGGALSAITYALPVASAQVKSAIILAALSASGTTRIIERQKSRDHTQRMLPSFGAPIRIEGDAILVNGGAELAGQDVEVPGDFSSAAFFIAAGLLVKDAEIIVRGCGINPTRTGFLDVIRRMGGQVHTENEREMSGEPVGDIVCRYSPGIRAAQISGEEIPLLIDEFPLLALLGTQAEGLTEIRDAAELRVKESDRIRAMVQNLRVLGCDVEELDDGIRVQGRTTLRGGRVESFGDHRIAMTMAVAGLI